MKIFKLFLLTTIIVAFKISAMEEEAFRAALRAPLAKPAEEHYIIAAAREGRNANVNAWVLEQELKIADTEGLKGREFELRAWFNYNPRTKTITITGTVNKQPALFYFNSDGSYRNYEIITPGGRVRTLRPMTTIKEEGE